MKLEVPQEIIEYAVWQTKASNDNFGFDPKQELKIVDRKMDELREQKLKLLQQIKEDETKQERFVKFLNDIGYDLERHNSTTVSTALQDKGASE